MAEQNTGVAPLLAIGGLAAVGLYFLTRKPTTPPPPPSETFQLTIATGPSGNTSPAPGVYEYDANTQVFVTAMPIQGYKFDKWTGDVTEAQVYQNPISLLMTKDLSIKANFVANPTPTMYSVTFSAQAGGTITPSGTRTYEANSYVTVQATPSAGYKFMGWSGNWTGNTNPDQVKIFRDNMVVIAMFTPVQQNGVQLQTGWNNAIEYMGNSGTPAAVFASVVPYLKPWQGIEGVADYPIWVWRNGQWLTWHPGVPAEWWDLLNTLKQVYQSDLCYIYVTQAVFWTWL